MGDRKQLNRIEKTGKAVCTKCKKELPLAAFHRHSIAYSRYTCRACLGAYQKKYNKTENGKSYYRRYNLKHFTGLSLEEYEGLLALQDRKCYVCGNSNANKRSSRLHVDHDHITGNIRGLLCSNCNTALGLFRDSVFILERAIAYLAS